MIIGARRHLSTIGRIAICFAALLLLQLNVPTPQNCAVSISFDLPAKPFESIIDWTTTRVILASVQSGFSFAQKQLAKQEEGDRKFKIVKVESRKIDKNRFAGRIWPVKGPVSSGFGMRRHPVTLKRSFHNGIDIKARRGTQIVAPEDGVVISAGHAGLLGRLVKIKTGKGKILYFGHMQKISCLKGQRIKRGGAIGTVGSSGRATGPHLHFTVVSSGKYLNPMHYLAAN